MFFKEGYIQLLTQLGFTRTQASIYLKILELGKTDARKLSEKTSTPRAVVYRAIDNLQKKGLVEKEIEIPYKFRGIPINEALQILMAKQFQHYKTLQKKTEQLLRKSIDYCEAPSFEKEYKFVVVEGRERILQRMKLQHANVQRRADLISTLPRWLNICQHCFEDYVKALDRNVKYRLILEENDLDNSMPENVEKLLEKRNFALRFCASRLVSNLGVFDGSEVIFNYYPSKSLKESPIIWTNHPSLIMMAQDHFNTIWKSSKEHS